MRCDGELLASIALWPTLAASAQTHQVPVDQVKQADTAFKAGYAALTSNDLQTAQEDFQKVVKLVPQVEEGHSALGAVLLQLNLFRKRLPSSNERSN
jgi:protein O-GlcNAc transferase